MSPPRYRYNRRPKMRKRKLKRRLRECRAALDEEIRASYGAGDDAARGICMPVPSWRDREELGIRYETPGLCAEEREQIRLLEVKLADRDAQLGAERATVTRLQRELRDERRHLDYHHQNGSFTLVRDVNPQVQAENTRLREQLALIQRGNEGLVRERFEARHALAWHVACRDGGDADWGSLLDEWREHAHDTDD